MEQCDVLGGCYGRISGGVAAGEGGGVPGPNVPSSFFCLQVVQLGHCCPWGCTLQNLVLHVRCTDDILSTMYLLTPRQSPLDHILIGVIDSGGGGLGAVGASLLLSFFRFP